MLVLPMLPSMGVDVCRADVESDRLTDLSPSNTRVGDRRWLAGATWPNELSALCLLKGLTQSGSISAEWHVRSVPTMILLNDAGAEIKRKVGSMSEAELLEFLKG